MTRKEYMDLLSRALENVEPEVARDIMEDYEAHFERAKESGRGEEEVIAELGSIEEFREELEAFISREKNGEKKTAEARRMPREEGVQMNGVKEEAPDERKEDSAQKADAKEEGAPGENTKAAHADAETGETENGNNWENKEANTAQESGQNAGREEEQKQREEVKEELERARREMERAFEEMQRARRELERAAREQERAARETEDVMKEAAREASRAEREMEKEMVRDAEKETVRDAEKEAERLYRRAAQEAGRTSNVDIDNIIHSAKNIAGTVLSQVSGVMDKAFSGFGDWMGSFEKSGEDMADYRRRQEGAKAEAAEYQRSRGAGSENQEKKKQNGDAYNYNYAYSYDYDNGGQEEEQYMPECSGIVTQEEGIRHIVIDSKSAEVDIRPAEDGTLFYHYINEGSTGSKVAYWCKKSVSQGTLTLSIMYNERAGRKNHSSILGGVFEGNPDLRLELRLPKWVEALEVSGKSGDIEMEGANICTLMLKSMSGDITMRQVNADKCMAESMSGDVNIKEGAFGYLLASSKSGDASAQNVKAEKAAFKSMSGDAEVESLLFGEAVASSMSGDAKACNVKGKVISVSSMSGDAYARGVSASSAKVSAVSGDAEAEDVTSDHLLMTVSSGDLQGDRLAVKVLKASSASGDMSMRGHADQMNLTSGSGDVVVVQNGDTKAAISTRSGEVNFHLKNEGAGFAAKVSTHGESNYRYKDLHLHDVANGIHRYGMEGSSLEIKSTSGDITITD